MAQSNKAPTALPERPKPPSTEEMLEDLKNADDKDSAFLALRNIVNDTKDTENEGPATTKEKLNKNLQETHAALGTENLNENCDISKEFEKVKRYLETNDYLQTSQESLQTELNKLISAKDEITNIMKQLQEQLEQR